MKWVFFLLVLIYCLVYAPYGINETDGGFLTGLAWQVLSGKALYADVVYVRPPLPILLRVAELRLLPDQLTLLGERWIFYGIVALYSWLGIGALVPAGKRRWWLAMLTFIVSVHCYPATAWHTTYGILFAASGIWLSTQRKRNWVFFLSGLAMAAAMLCKQSFYPMGAVFTVLLFFQKNTRAVICGLLGLFIPALAWLGWLWTHGALANYFALTGGAAEGGQALQHGLLDYLQIQPTLVATSVVLLAPVVWWFWKNRNSKLAMATWNLWLIALAGSFVRTVWLRQEFTAPFAQARVCFVVAVAYGLWLWRKGTFSMVFWSLTALSWCAAVSWGYALPILFAAPWVWALSEITSKLWSAGFGEETNKDVRQRAGLKPASLGKVLYLLLLLSTFRLGYEFVYRDAHRQALNVDLGVVFPSLSGIYSDSSTLALYQDLKNLAARYPDFKTLPSFPEANFLTKTYPPLPLDWVVKREMGNGAMEVQESWEKQRPILFIEKAFAASLETDPQLAFTRERLRQGKMLAETPHFWVVQ